MLLEKTEAAPLPAAETKLSFFRQSGWMLVASLGSGLLMWAVHKFASQMPKAEYGEFTTLLQVLNMMMIPAMGLQMTFAQQAVALDGAQRRQLVGTVRGVFKTAVWGWLLLAVGMLFFRGYLTSAYKISNPISLWLTWLAGFLSVCLPVFSGLLQGKMDFNWLGWSSMFNAMGRLGAVYLLVVLLGGQTMAAMIAISVGLVLGVGTAAWHTRDFWLGPAEPIAWRPWLRRVVPLSLGYGAATVMLAFDMIVVRRFFTDAETTGPYGAAGMLGRALVFLTAPLTWVMFPRIVRSAALAEKSDVMAQALGATALVGGAGALGYTLFPELPLKIMYHSSYLSSSHLVPWFGWCMLPLTLSNVLLNNLLARQRFAVVPWLMVVAAVYATTLWFYHRSFESVVATLGIFSVLFLGVCSFFTWRK